MGKEILIFDDIETEKQNFHHYKSAVFFDIDIDNVLASNNICINTNTINTETINTLLVICMMILKLNHCI